jgi:hypothetical protein
MVAIHGPGCSCQAIFAFFLRPLYFRLLAKGKQQLLGDAWVDLSPNISTICVAFCEPGAKSLTSRTLCYRLRVRYAPMAKWNG